MFQCWAAIINIYATATAFGASVAFICITAADGDIMKLCCRISEAPGDNVDAIIAVITNDANVAAENSLMFCAIALIQILFIARKSTVN